MPKVKIQPSLIKNTTVEYWTNHRVCPYCGYSALLMEGYHTRQCPACGLEFNISTGLKPKGQMKTKVCLTCNYFSKEKCGYVASNGTKDKGGNIVSLNFQMAHNCPDWVQHSKPE